MRVRETSGPPPSPACEDFRRRGQSASTGGARVVHPNLHLHPHRRRLEEAGEQGVEPLSDGKAALRISGLGVTDESCSFKGGEGFQALTAGDGEGAALVGAADAACAFRDVEDRALRGAERFVAELRVADVGGLDGEQELDGDLVSDEAVMEELRRRARIVASVPGLRPIRPVKRRSELLVEPNQRMYASICCLSSSSERNEPRERTYVLTPSAINRSACALLAMRTSGVPARSAASTRPRCSRVSSRGFAGGLVGLVPPKGPGSIMSVRVHRPADPWPNFPRTALVPEAPERRSAQP
jgi:hypothetical protein